MQRVWGMMAAVVLLCFCLAPARAEEKVLSGLTEAELQKSFDRLSPKWYPTHIKGYAKGKESRYDITWKTGDPGWYVNWGLTGAEFSKLQKERSSKGYKVAVESKWAVEGQERFAVIWRKK